MHYSVLIFRSDFSVDPFYFFFFFYSFIFLFFYLFILCSFFFSLVLSLFSYYHYYRVDSISVWVYHTKLQLPLKVLRFRHLYLAQHPWTFFHTATLLLSNLVLLTCRSHLRLMSDLSYSAVVKDYHLRWRR